MARRRTYGRISPGGYRGGLPQGFRPFTPFGTPPTGSYDPALDAQVGAANRGLFDLTQDTETQRGRLGTDYNLNRDQIIQGRDRGLADLGTGQTRATEDHTRAIEMLTRNYQQLGKRQAQGQARAGVLSGGAVLQAAAKRAANKALEQQPIDTSFQRYSADNTLQQQRLGQDAESQLGQLALNMAPPDAGDPLGGRQFQDLGTTLTRAGRENTNFGLDTAAEKAFQASGAGWDPGQKPANEFIGPMGPYRGVRRGGTYFRINPNGSIRSRRPVRR